MYVNIKNIIRPPYHYILKGKPVGYVFMLHRVDDIDSKKLSANENMKVSPSFLDAFLEKYNRDYDFIALKDIPSRLNDIHNKRFMAFTMDDGYKDNYTKALPIFEKHKTPFTIFVATDFPDCQAYLWWYILEDYILANNRIRLSNGIIFKTETKEEKENAFMEIRALILGLDQTNIASEVEKLLGKSFSWREKCDELAMGWEDIKCCVNHQLVTIGAHTQHHYNLKALNSVEDVNNEIMDGCKRMEEKIEYYPSVFAYPFGSPNEVGRREIDIARNLNFEMAFVAGGGYCGTRINNLYSIPRIMLTEQFEESMLK